ncbi:MAG: Asp-tRNA(Asn)/Glu-tRNA(Gln) amidotransferase subunit GatB [Deltaproteobacteria bacterium]|jgi:aspartyl-tRNA(Asn)/glutamyl-tRNA(Gln) amidotransferase subunit B|nr:Asp-tRNA(Asn)/Glu-tRNA(Gln) amidotransferase subunit GatB [Deltaproteobacteria bacterium]
MLDLEPVIGLEIHAQLLTRTKLFCACPTEFGAEPNSNICEVCSGQPGALPRMNGKALELAATAGLALGSRVNSRSLFSRKNYFYPDLPNGFQTSQLDPPICEGGSLSFRTADGGTKSARLNRVHLEDDAGKCVHDEKRGVSLVDLNRAGTPLIEIVTEPDLSSSYEAMEFLKKLHALLVFLKVTEGRMEEGEFRCDVNISLRPRGSSQLGVRGEIKNLNSFKFVGQAIEYEIVRQTALYERGEPVLQETLHFDSRKGETRSLRSKEEAHDYRYFPQPDLPPVVVPEATIEALRRGLPESPERARERLVALGLREAQIALLLERVEFLEYFDQALAQGGESGKIASLMEELFLPQCQKEGISPLEAPMKPAFLASLAKILASGAVGRRKIQELFGELYLSGRDPAALLEAKGASQISDEGALREIVAGVIAKFPQDARKYAAGEEKVLSFLVGKVMKESGGRANPQKAAELLKAELAPRGV